MYCQVLTIDQAKESASMIIDLYYDWIDPRLRWDPANYSGISIVTIGKTHTVWIPDALPYDILEFSSTLPDEQQFANIEYNGHVSYYQTNVIEFICRLNLKRFPFDTQTCALKLSSFNFPAKEMPIKGFIDPTVLSSVSDSSNGEWSLLKILNNYTESGYSDREYSIVTFSFFLRRSRTYYVVLMIIPSFILTLLCVIGLFWENFDNECYMDNLNLGFAAILAMMFVLQMVTADMPKTSETDKLSIYLIVNLGIITIASVTVMLMGKSSGVSLNGKETWSRLRKFLKLRLHVLFMLIFLTLSLINFIVLFS